MIYYDQKEVRNIKKVLTIVLFLVWICCLAGCRQPDGPKTTLPENAVALTIDNVTDYFTIKVITDCEYDLSAGQTVVTSYVAFVPKGEYDTVYGEVEFEVNCCIRQPSNQNVTIRVQEDRQKLRLKAGVINGQYRRDIGIEEGYGFQVDPEQEHIMLRGVTGYVVPGQPQANAYEKLTENERSASAGILEELRKKLTDYREDFSEAKNYFYSSNMNWQFLSIYGGDRNAYSQDTGEDIRGVDLENQRYTHGRYQYFVRAGQVYQQYENELGLVMRTKSDLDIENFQKEATPRFEEVLDPNAVYLRQGENYYALTTFKNMSDGSLKQRLVEQLDAKGITGDPEAFVVKYSYDFSGRNFAFQAEVLHRGDHEQSQYIDNYIHYSWKVTDLNKAKVELWAPDEGSFALEQTLEEAMIYKTGMVRISEFTRKVEFAVFQVVSESASAEVDNFLPIEVLEGGLYTFRASTGQRVTMYNADGEIYRGMYYPEGIYYLKYSGVPYGKTPVILQIGVTPLEDFGDLYDPIVIEDDHFQVYLEKMGDMQTFRFVPKMSGIYELTACDTPVQVYLYDADAPQQILASCHQPYMTMRLEAGKAYVLAIQQYPAKDGPLTWDVTVNFVGAPSEEPQPVDSQWQDIFMAGADSMLCVNVEEPGLYVMEVERVAGMEDWYGFFCDEDGMYVPVEMVVLEDGTEAYVLRPGQYYYCIDVSQYYFKGCVRLVQVGTADEG